MSVVGIDEDVYAATLREVKRQAAQLHLARAGSGSGSSGDGSGNSTPGSSTDAEAASEAASGSSGSGWVVLESATTPAVLPTAAGCPVWPQAQWQIAYEILFCQCPPTVARLRPHQADDMLFFVYTDEAAAAARTRLFVRRRQARTAALPADLSAPLVAVAEGTAGTAGTGGTAGRARVAGASAPAGASKAAQVDWRASVLLMVVLQSGYRLSVVTADDPELLGSALHEPEGETSTGRGTAGGGNTSNGGANCGSGSSGGTRVRRVTEVVHASPSRVLVNLDQSRSDTGPQASYPDICFAVDSCDHGFQSQVLRQPGDCYCVLLHADVASSWSLPASQQAAAASTEAGSSGTGGGEPAAGREAVEEAEVPAGMATLSLAEQQQQQQQQQQEEEQARSSGDGGSSEASRGSVSHRHLAGAAGAGQGQGQVQGQGQAAAVVFSGYVSHSQLTGALGGQLAGDPLRQVLRAAAAAARGQTSGRGASSASASAAEQQQPLATCRVVMRGPGGRGAADVAVSSFPPARLPAGGDVGHLPGSFPTATAGPSALPSAAAPRTGPGRPKLFERAQLLARGMAAAAKQAAAGHQGGGGGAAGVPVDQLHLRCALMQLQVPVDMLAAAILEAL